MRCEAVETCLPSQVGMKHTAAASHTPGGWEKALPGSPTTGSRGDQASQLLYLDLHHEFCSEAVVLIHCPQMVMECDHVTRRPSTAAWGVSHPLADFGFRTPHGFSDSTGLDSTRSHPPPPHCCRLNCSQKPPTAFSFLLLSLFSHSYSPKY